jgi:hypothetical protein
VPGDGKTGFRRRGHHPVQIDEVIIGLVGVVLTALSFRSSVRRNRALAATGTGVAAGTEMVTVP